MTKYKFLLPLILLLVACGEPEVKTLDQLTKIEIEADINKTVQRIASVAHKGNYDYIKILLPLTQSPIEAIRESAGAAIEKIVGQEFGFTSTQEEQRRLAVKKAKLWWEKNSGPLVKSFIFNKYKPYLELEFNGKKEAKEEDDEFEIVIRDYLLRREISNNIKSIAQVNDVFYSIQFMKDYGKDIWVQCEQLLLDPKESQLLKEKIAFILSGQNARLGKNKELLLKYHMPGIMKNCKQIDKRCGLYSVWAEVDLKSAKQQIWKDHAQADEATQNKYLKTAVGFDNETVRDFLLEELKSTDAAKVNHAVRFIGEFGYSEYIDDLIDALSRTDSSSFRRNFLGAVFQLGVTRTIDKILKRILDDKTPEAQRLTFLNTLSEGMLADYMDEYDHKITLIKTNEDKNIMAAAILLQSGHSTRVSVHKLIESLDHVETKETELEVFKALRVITGYDFPFDEQAYSRYSRLEKGSETEKRRRYRKNRAELWWEDNKTTSPKHWINEALRAEGFNKLARDKHQLSEKEIKLLKRFVVLDPTNGLAYLKVVFETGNAKNQNVVLDIIQNENIVGKEKFLLSKIRNKKKAIDPLIATIFCRVVNTEYHKELRLLLSDRDLSVAKEAGLALQRLHGHMEIDALIDLVENGEREIASVANNLLKKISQNDFGDLLYITKPQRKHIVNAWKEWWRVVYDYSYPGAWQKKEIDRLISEIDAGQSQPSYWRRIDTLTHYREGFNDIEELKRFWSKQKDLWSGNSRYVMDLISGNWWRVEKAQVVLMAQGTHDDVAHMIQLLDHRKPKQNDTILPVLRVLTGLDMGYSSSLNLLERKGKVASWKWGWMNNPLTHLNHVVKQY